MRRWSAQQVAKASHARVVAGGEITQGPTGVVVDSRRDIRGTLFVGLPGERVDGGAFVAQALARGAWGTLSAASYATPATSGQDQAVLAAEEPLASLQQLATGWRHYLRAAVVGVTGSTGKTSTKDLIGALVSPHRRTLASHANFNTEIGLPLEICNAPGGTEVLVLEMGMRGPGQIAELARIAEPDVGVIVSIGPVHLELLGSIEAIAAAKSELIAGLPSGGTAIIPANEPLLEPHLRDDVQIVRFGDGGDVRLISSDGNHLSIDAHGETVELEVPFSQAHMRENLLAAVAAARAVGVTPSGRVELTLSPGRGQVEQLPGGTTLIDDSYNANPMSMRAALDELAATSTPRIPGRRVAILGDMLELGPDELRYHEEIGQHAMERGADVLITVGRLAEVMGNGFRREVHVTANAAEAAALAGEIVQPGDVVLVKASRGVGLEVVCEALRTRAAGATATI